MSKKSCFVPSCINNSEDNSDRLFIPVPKDPKIRKRWFEAVHLARSTTHSNIYCCEDHFELEKCAENLVEFKLLSERLRLKPGTVPHRYIETPKPLNLKSQITSSSKKRKAEHKKAAGVSVKRRLFSEGKSETVSTEVSIPMSASDSRLVESPSGKFTIPISASSSCLVESPSGKFTVSAPTEPPTETSIETIPKVGKKHKKIQCLRRPSHRSVNVQTDKIEVSTKGTNTLPHTFVRPQLPPQPISDTSSKSSSQGSSSSETSTRPTSSLASASTGLEESSDVLETKSRFYLGLPSDTYFVVNLVTKWSSLRSLDIMVTLKKIRLNDPYERLGDDFKISGSYVGRIFNKSVPIMASLFKPMIHWPKADIIKAMLPIPFRYRYSNVQSIIDCFEVEIEVLSDPLKQAMTWSQYKHCNTVKYLMSATPHGLINFISCGYGGRATDKAIVEDCGFLNIVPEGCDVMADRGFKGIAISLHEKGCGLTRPPSVINKEQSTREEVLESKRIAALRIHIERVIRRVREFDFLKPHASINHKLLYLVDNVCIIVCGIINLQGALIK